MRSRRSLSRARVRLPRRRRRPLSVRARRRLEGLLAAYFTTVWLMRLFRRGWRAV